jgi:hypothetical protein
MLDPLYADPILCESQQLAGSERARVETTRDETRRVVFLAARLTTTPRIPATGAEW